MAKCGIVIRSKNEVAQVNTLLCKVLCRNICELIQSMYELGVPVELGENARLRHLLRIFHDVGDERVFTPSIRWLRTRVLLFNHRDCALEHAHVVAL